MHYLPTRQDQQKSSAGRIHCRSAKHLHNIDTVVHVYVNAGEVMLTHTQCSLLRSGSRVSGMNLAEPDTTTVNTCLDHAMPPCPTQPPSKMPTPELFRYYFLSLVHPP
jgi:hypothetical protein